MKPNPKT